MTKTQQPQSLAKTAQRAQLSAAKQAVVANELHFVTEHLAVIELRIRLVLAHRDGLHRPRLEAMLKDLMRTPQ